MRRKSARQRFEKVEVIDAGAKGKAVAKAPDGRVIFLSNAVPGDVVDVLTTKKRSAVREGVATHVQSRSDRRKEPKLQHLGGSGGGKWQRMEHRHQLFYKQREVENNLRRIGGLDLPKVSPILGSENEYFYRNKMEFSFSDSRWLNQEEIESGVDIGDRNALGFHIPGMWDKILDIEKCHLQQDPSNALRLEVKRFAVEHGLDFYNPKRQEGLLRT